MPGDRPERRSRRAGAVPVAAAESAEPALRGSGAGPSTKPPGGGVLQSLPGGEGGALVRGDTVAGLERLVSLPRLNSFGGGGASMARAPSLGCGAWGPGLAADPFYSPFDGPGSPSLNSALDAFDAFEAEVPMIDLTVMGDRKPSMALLDHRGVGMFRPASTKSFGDLQQGAMVGPFLPQHHPGPMAMAPGPAPHLYGHPQMAAAAPVVAYPGHLMPAAAPAPFQSKLQQRAAKRMRRPTMRHDAASPLGQRKRPSPSSPHAGAAIAAPSCRLVRACDAEHAAPQETHAPKGVPHGMADYTDAVRLLKPNEDVFWQLMRNSKGLRDGARGDLEASFQILYFDQARSPVFVDEVLKRIKRLDSNGEERKFKRVERLSDNQELCLASLGPQLFVPTNVAKRTFRLTRIPGGACCERRNEVHHRRILGNYYYTGFCHDHVFAEGSASLAAWKASGGRTLLGFNAVTPNAQENKPSRQRHFLCLETFAGKVFLKWCTQCHTWKNLKLFSPEDGPTEVRTFCHVCHQRQIFSRQSRKNIPKKKKRKR